MLSGLKSGGGGWGLCARSYTHLAYISPTRTHPRGWIVHERAGQTRTKRLYAGAARLDTFSLSVSSYQRNDHSPAPPNQARTRWTERERERENRQSVAGCIRHPERRGGGRKREREVRPFEKAPRLMRRALSLLLLLEDRERARILLK